MPTIEEFAKYVPDVRQVGEQYRIIRNELNGNFKEGECNNYPEEIGRIFSWILGQETMYRDEKEPTLGMMEALNDHTKQHVFNTGGYMEKLYFLDGIVIAGFGGELKEFGKNDILLVPHETDLILKPITDVTYFCKYDRPCE